MSLMNNEWPDLSPPDEETLRKHGLVYYGGKLKEPVFCNVAEVWATAIEKDTPVYALFTYGTNGILILEKRGDNEWERLDNIGKIKNLHGLMWRMMLELESAKPTGMAG